MPRPPRKISPSILRTLHLRPKLRYTLTKKGTRAFEAGETPYQDTLDSLVMAIQANNKQPVSFQTWQRFHAPRKITNEPLRALLEGGITRIVSRGKFTMAAE